MKKTALLLAPLLATALASIHCGDTEDSPHPAADAGTDAASGEAGLPGPGPGPGPGDAGGNDAGPGPEPADPPLVPASKVDLLFVVDNSQSMGTKQDFLAKAASRVVKGLTTKNLHIGVISSSLGNRGGDVCLATNPRTDDRGHLLNPTGVAGAEPGFLSFGTGTNDTADLDTLATRTGDIIRGIGQDGCGIEMQLEAMYRFVSDPTPSAVTLDALKQAQYAPAIDYDLLAQRKAFFRPDSAVAIIMLTDEDDGSIDPLAISGFGYAFVSTSFPGSSIARSGVGGHTAPRGTSVCANDPTSPDCTSCGFAANCDPNTESCQKLRNDAVCTDANKGYFGPDDDDLNVRMFDMKRRFGVEPRYAVSRYTKALSGRRVPRRETEHVVTIDAAGKRQIADYQQAASCTNPLFATNLPEKEGDELCNLGDSTRSSKLVFFGLLGGMPKQLTSAPVDWTKLVGADPDKYDGTGLDPHMVQSIAPRSALAAGGDPDSPRGQNGTDPINGREWNTKKKDLQYACTVALPTARACAASAQSCDCQDDPTKPGAPLSNPPLCKADGSAVQIREKAYPTYRELVLAKSLGDRALIGSMCDVDAQSSYGSFLDAFAIKVNGSLTK